MNFNQTLQFRALRTKAHIEGEAFNAQEMEKAIEEAASKSDDFKTVCAPISIPLFDRLNDALNLLDMSKRSFIELALIHALDEVDKVIAEVNVFENVPGEVVIEPTASEVSDFEGCEK